jgi:hypothetical protein
MPEDFDSHQGAVVGAILIIASCAGAECAPPRVSPRLDELVIEIWRGGEEKWLNRSQPVQSARRYAARDPGSKPV